AAAVNTGERLFRRAGAPGPAPPPEPPPNINPDGVPNVGGALDQDFALVAYNANTPGCPVISPAPASLPGGTIGTAYSQTITASGGTAPYTFAVTSGTLPAGLTLSTSGAIS